jgi:hypothetical protein
MGVDAMRALGFLVAVGVAAAGFGVALLARPDGWVAVMAPPLLLGVASALVARPFGTGRVGVVAVVAGIAVAYGLGFGTGFIAFAGESFALVVALVLLAAGVGYLGVDRLLRRRVPVSRAA